PVEHAQSGAQDRNHDGPRFGDAGAGEVRDRRRDLLVLDGQWARGLVGQQHHELFGELPEAGGVRVSIAQDGEFVGDERVICCVKMHTRNVTGEPGMRQWSTPVGASTMEACRISLRSWPIPATASEPSTSMSAMRTTSTIWPI